MVKLVIFFFNFLNLFNDPLKAGLNPSSLKFIRFIGAIFFLIFYSTGANFIAYKLNKNLI